MQNSKKLIQSAGVTVLQRKKYSCLCKIFCCKCAYCCQSLDFSLLTSEHRKGVFFTMINQYINSIQSQPNIIIDPFFILLGLLLGEQDQQINTATLSQIGDNGQKHSIFSKQDLEMYIPQLCTYLVFHQQMQNIPIFNLLQRTARFDIQFALLYYSYMRSLEIINQNTKFKVVMKYNKTFKRKIDQHFKFLNDSTVHTARDSQDDIVKHYSGRGGAGPKLPKYQKIHQNPYRRLYKSCFNQQKVVQDQSGVFSSSLNFISDLVWLGNNLIKMIDRKATLSQHLQQINRKLPADIYLPFKNPAATGMKVANIVFEQCRVFSTKMRVPFYVCVQVYQQKIQGRTTSKQKRIVSTVNLNANESNLRKSHLFQQDSIDEQEISQSKQNKQTKVLNEKKKPVVKNNLLIQSISKVAKKARRLYKKTSSLREQQAQTDCEIAFENVQQQQTLMLFGESQAEQQKRIKMISPFSDLPGHKLVHFIVKTEDDLRQQAFAMQLLEQFNQIFKMENLDIHVVPYEVVPLGHNCGFIQYLKDTLTIDQIRKREGNLQFIKKDPIKLNNFMNTLIGYSLVTYFLQVKDRHNGNIMVRRDGSLIHIDYGFFMSNAPGKGVQLQKKVAFKMTNQYIDVLGGLDSKDFQQFRKLFFLGYQACRKHQHRILILAKLMYSSHGSTMPCFIKGNTAINSLQDRLNPPGMRTDGDLSLHCQNLINSTIDNWRANWYDKWQYYFQGILY